MRRGGDGAARGWRHWKSTHAGGGEFAAVGGGGEAKDGVREVRKDNDTGRDNEGIDIYRG